MMLKHDGLRKRPAFHLAYGRRCDILSAFPRTYYPSVGAPLPVCTSEESRVNESAGDQITELLHDNLHLSDTDDLDGPSDDADADVESPIRTTREGLPGSFRMRHDAHYVDELMSRTVPEPPPTPARADKPLSVPASVPATEPPATGAALSLIASRLESVVTHAAAIRPHPIEPSLMAQSVQAEFGRLARLARAAAVLQERETPMRRNLSLRDIADRVTAAARPVARMGGVDFEITVDDPAFTILAESALVVQAITGTIDAVVDLLLADARRPPADGDSAPRISISLQSVKIRPALILDVICPALFVSGQQAERFFDNAADDYRIAPAAGILLASAAYVVRAHGGRADVKRHSGIGASITYVFPQAVAEYGLT